MLGRKNYTQEELEHGRAAVKEQIAVYKKHAKEITSQKTDKKLQSALENFEGLFFNDLTLALDRYCVHRLQIETGKDGNLLNAVELI